MRILNPLAIYSLALLCVSGIAQTSRPHFRALPPASSTPHNPEATLPVVPARVEHFGLLAPSVGWISTGRQLLWTKDNGETWIDISPPAPTPIDPNEARFSGVFFLNASTGWVLYRTHIQSSAGNSEAVDHQIYQVYIAFTNDSGRTWITLGALPNPAPWEELTGSGTISFSDAQHGWVDLGVLRGGILLKTSDGGHTWNHVPGDLGGDLAVVAVTPTDAFFSGGLDNSLFSTHDAGRTIEEIDFAIPPELPPNSAPTYGIPTFTSHSIGYEPVVYRGPLGTTSTAILFSTKDDGRTWAPDRSITGLAEGAELFGAVIDSIWQLPFISTSGKVNLVTLNPHTVAAAPLQSATTTYGSCRAQFITTIIGWTSCAGRVESTLDGGSTWATITPRTRGGTPTSEPLTPRKTRTVHLAPQSFKAVPQSGQRLTVMIASSTGISQQLAFDRTDVLSTTEMQTWWTHSPYYDVGIYLPGSPNRSSHHTYATSDWISTVTGYGWGIWPIWFGLQASCVNNTNIHHRISTDVATAASQGSQQADAAYDAATNLDLDGSVLYFDLEPYDTQNATCSASVRAYIGAFVEEAKEDGASYVGAYGDVFAVPGDFNSSSPKPDDVWVANNSGHRATVWNLGAGALGTIKNAALTDDLWSNHERIHQYMIDSPTVPNYEAWGDANSYRIDDDIVDTTIYPSQGAKDMSSLTYTSANYSDSSPSWMLDIANGENNGQTSPAFTQGTAVGVYAPNPLSADTNGFVWPADTVLSYENDPLDYPVTEAIGTNDLGQVVGFYQDIEDSGITNHGFIWTANGFTALDVPDAQQTQLYSINDAEWIAGWFIDQDGNSHCVLIRPIGGSYTNDSFTQFDEPGGTCFTAAVNGIGQIVGDYTASDGSTVPFIEDAETSSPGVNPVLLPSSGDTVVWSMNNNQVIVGWDDAGSIAIIPPETYDWLDTDPSSGFSGVNDDLEFVGGDSEGGFVVDVPH